jgi:hypothetical protein
VAEQTKAFILFLLSTAGIMVSNPNQERIHAYTVYGVYVDLPTSL